MPGLSVATEKGDPSLCVPTSTIQQSITLILGNLGKDPNYQDFPYHLSLDAELQESLLSSHISPQPHCMTEIIFPL